jgi:hypothetical protein
MRGGSVQQRAQSTTYLRGLDGEYVIGAVKGVLKAPTDSVGAHTEQC